MSTAVLSNHMESPDLFRQNHQNLFMGRRQLNQADYDVLGLLLPSNNRTPVVGSRSRNSSGGSSSDSSSASSIPKFTTAPANRMVSFPEGFASHPKDIPMSGVPHRKLDRSISEPVERVLSGTSPQSQKSVNSTRYKTELCRPFEESGFCKYGDKCQFAHGDPELRSLNRHPKYKTELCRTFHTVGFCPYGPRCHFIHNEDERRLSQINTLKHHQVQDHQAHQQQLQAVQQLLAQAQQQVQQAQQAARSQPPTPTKPPMSRPRALNLPVMMRSSLGSTADSPPLSVTGSPTTSPTAMLTEHHDSLLTHPAMYRSPTPPPQSAPPGFSAHPFSFHDALGSVSPISAADMSLTPSPPLASPLNVHTDDAIGNLAAGLQAASLQLNPDHYRLTESKFRPYLPPSPPSSLDDLTPQLPGESPLAADISRGLRLPIFSKFGQHD